MALSIVLMDAGAKSVHGVDLDERGLEKLPNG
jgi:ribosomal protein L11 methylase PrmA